eukprot:TRINITY_DN5349_c0_g4_i1.p1 TRINITY_DN5349_c0_g4~~TRINITY_DN5349_c0_g4_i1.p1  ORF type:complete len:426 (-),score=102.81 TRINITY_DN5349_c0_g4_i1:32-1309(-)
MSEPLTDEDFLLQKHGLYFRSNIKELPAPYKSMDANRLTLLYFCVSGLDVLGQLENDEKLKAKIAEQIYDWMSPWPDNGGFYGYPVHDTSDRVNAQPHIANTYVALVMLIMVGDDLSHVRRDAIAASLRKWQLPSGSFCCYRGMSPLDSESDMRFVYCAAAICYMLDLWHAVDVDAMFRFIVESQAFDGAFGMDPTCEGHGGCTYCAVASLYMMGRLDDLAGKDRLIEWCVKRQQVGFQGRIEKPEDTCYTWWVGGALTLLGASCFIHTSSCLRFLKQCEHSYFGGFRKLPESSAPDLLHSYMSVCGLSLCGLLEPMNAALGMTERSARRFAHNFRLAPGGRPWTPPLLPSPAAGSAASAPASAGVEAEAVAPAAAATASSGLEASSTSSSSAKRSCFELSRSRLLQGAALALTVAAVLARITQQ